MLNSKISSASTEYSLVLDAAFPPDECDDEEGETYQRHGIQGLVRRRQARFLSPGPPPSPGDMFP